MKLKKLRQILFGILTTINIVLIVLLCLAAAVVIYASHSAESGETPQFLGYSIYVTETEAEGSPNTAVITQQKDPRELSYGDEIICREFSADGSFYPISCTFIRASDETPLTATVKRDGDITSIDINRDDILGQRVASSVLLGNIINALKNSENQKHALLIFGGGGIILCLLLSFFYWVLRHRQHKKECPAPIEGKSVDLFGLIEEQEGVNLSVLPDSSDKAEEEIPVALDGWKNQQSLPTQKEIDTQEKTTVSQ